MARKSHKNIGLIGLGIIGSRVAASLRGAGFHVYVWNRSPRAAPNFLGSAAEIAEVCNTIQLFVPDAQALFETIDAFADRLTPSHTILCSATVGPEATVEAARLVQQCGAKFLDAPFTGSKAAAEKGELVYFIGGDDDVLRQVEPVLQASGKAIVKIGEIGAAATVKIATNMLGAVIVQTLAEAIALVKTAGIDPEILGSALEHHGVRSPLIDMKLPGMLQGDFPPNFSMKHMFKDVQIGMHIANSVEMDLPATTAAAGVLYAGLNSGWGELDYSAVVKVYEETKRAPLELREPERGRALPAPEKAAEPEPVPPVTPVENTIVEPAAAPPPEEPSESKADDTNAVKTEDKPVVEAKPETEAAPPSNPAEPAKMEARPKTFGWLFGKK